MSFLSCSASVKKHIPIIAGALVDVGSVIDNDWLRIGSAGIESS
jgi:hypothetical protein